MVAAVVNANNTLIGCSDNCFNCQGTLKTYTMRASKATLEFLLLDPTQLLEL